jgi:hypothetical protein
LAESKSIEEENFYQPNGPPSLSGVAILISDKVDFNLNLQETKKSLHITKMSNTLRGNNNCYLYVSSVSIPNFIKHIILDLKTQMDPPNTEVVGDLNSFFHQQIGHPDKKSTNKLYT